MLRKLCWIALAGGLGSLARYGLTGLVQRILGSGYPWGTTVVNLSGCFLFGVIWSLAEERYLISGEWRSILLIGFVDRGRTDYTGESPRDRVSPQRENRFIPILSSGWFVIHTQRLYPLVDRDYQGKLLFLVKFNPIFEVHHGKREKQTSASVALAEQKGQSWQTSAYGSVGKIG